MSAGSFDHASRQPTEKPGAADKPYLPLSKQPRQIAGMFDAIAPRYDFLNRLLSAGFDRGWRVRLVQSLKLTGDETLLDLCAGTADVALTARRASPGPRRIIGLDFASAMLKIGSRKIAEAGEDKAIALLRGDAMQLPIHGGGIDAVTVAFGVRNVENCADVCREMHRVLAPGGKLAILEFAVPTLPLVRQLYLGYFRWILPLLGRVVSRHSTAYSYLPASVSAFPTPERFAALLVDTGFADVSMSRLTFGIVYLYCGRKR